MALKRSRLLFLNLYVPLGVALYIGVARALPTVDVSTFKTFIIYASCAFPIYLVAHIGSYAAYKHIVRIGLTPQIALIFGAMVAIVFAFFYLKAFYLLVWNWLPWLESGFTYSHSENAAGFWDYLRSSTGLLFTPSWYSANAAYEYATRDRLYFPSKEKPSMPPPLESSTPAVQDPTDQIGLLAKLSQAASATIVALEAQQHYICVHTDTGREMVLYRFGDAVKEFEAQGLGVQVHRSFLIIPDAVVQTRREGRSLFLSMRNGLNVPVSQSYRGLVTRFALQS